MTVERLERYAFKNGHEQGVAEGIVTGAQQKAVVRVGRKSPFRVRQK